VSETRLYLVDASPYIFRAHFSVPETIRTPDGRPAAASYGFSTFLLRLLVEEKPSHLAMAFDRNLMGSFRNDQLPSYKQQRTPPPPEIEEQIDTCLAVSRALGAASFIDDRYEADDIIATLLARHPGQPAVIVTSDKDLAQLVNDHVTLYDLAKATRYDSEAVREKFGVRPDQIPDYLGLAGDSVDNIPGVKGIGAKSAAELLAHFAHLEDLYLHLDKVPRLPLRGAKSIHAKLAEQRDMAFLSRQLATVSRDAPGLPEDLDALAYQGADTASAQALFDRLGFSSMKERVAPLPQGTKT
jgi:5'-3' exonuclease